MNPEEGAEQVAHVVSPELAQLGLVIALAALAWLPLAWQLVRAIVPERNVFFARWGFSHAGLAVVVIAIASYAIAGIASLFGIEPGLELALIGTAAAFGAGVVYVTACALRLDPIGLGALGLRAGGNLRAILAGVLLYLAALPGIVGVMHAWGWFLEWSGAGFEPQSIAVQFARLAPKDMLLPLALGIVVVPLLEEVLFRAFLQPLLVQNLRETAGIFVTSVVFGVMHLEPSAIVPVFCLSLVLGVIMLRTQRLVAVWTVHALHNGLVFAVLLQYPEFVGTKGGT